MRNKRQLKVGLSPDVMRWVHEDAERLGVSASEHARSVIDGHYSQRGVEDLLKKIIKGGEHVWVDYTEPKPIEPLKITVKNEGESK